MAVTYEVKKDVKFTVNGKDYESLDEVPSQFRAAIEKALESHAGTTGTITVNGRTYASVEDLPEALRAIVRGLASTEMKGKSAAIASTPAVDALRPEPILSMKSVLVAAGVIVALFWLARLVL